MASELGCPGTPDMECSGGIHAKGLCRRCYYRRWRAANPELVTEHKRRFWKIHKETETERKSRWQKANPEKAAEYARRWYRNHPAIAAAKDQRWYDNNPEGVREKARRRRAVRAAVLNIPFTTEALRARMAYWGDRCWMCGREADTVDHVIPLAGGGPHVLSNLRPACRSCNSKKGVAKALRGDRRCLT